MRVLAAVFWIAYLALLVEVFRRLSKVTAEDEIICARLLALRARCPN